MIQEATTLDISTITGLDVIIDKKTYTNKEKCDLIIRFVSEQMGVTVEELKGKSRLREFVIARQLAQYFIHDYTNLSLKQVGKIFNRDHSTVIHSIESVGAFNDTDKRYRNRFDEMELNLMELL